MTANIADTDAPKRLDFALDGLEATEALARRLAPLLRAGDVVALDGDLGTGKTAFARALIRCLDDADTEVPSPTFTLVQSYDLPDFEIWHFDLYRLDAPQDALELGIDDAFAGAVSLIEWPQRLGPYLPAERLDIRFRFDDLPTVRHVTITGHGDWEKRLQSVREQ